VNDGVAAKYGIQIATEALKHREYGNLKRLRNMENNSVFL
jgi:hypothetical protein